MIRRRDDLGRQELDGLAHPVHARPAAARSYRSRARGAALGSRTYVPEPCTDDTRPCTRNVSNARAAVGRATLHDAASSRSDGTSAPGSKSPRTI